MTLFVAEFAAVMCAERLGAKACYPYFRLQADRLSIWLSVLCRRNREVCCSGIVGGSMSSSGMLLIQRLEQPGFGMDSSCSSVVHTTTDLGKARCAELS